ncbi:hypothetical protein BT93_L1058 [Corymbia citriodora subsp. variegata]|uniref:ADP-ribosyl cyclase/cyclic ADP-ribose hydrolase n=1 Tax=Corymbia citriodora subsp. variegata TaxID=360336 RepID=A0A8T0CNU2_CORYI|nr:hypothetical protein BT93_L1058 [Corymbia citriodora subsp. variegata]
MLDAIEPACSIYIPSFKSPSGEKSVNFDRVLRQLTKSKRRDLELTSITDHPRTSRTQDASGEEKEALRWDSESISRMDDASEERNEALNASETEYDVFLSFRGRDTRDNFTDCLYHRLKHVGLHVFLDNEELRVGKDIDGELSQALDKSRIYIPIFSQNYATSSWCLREIAYMEKCTSKSNRKKEILPIFYDVDPDDVKLKTELYKNAMRKHEEKFSLDELKRWEAALRKVAHLKGWDLKRKRQSLARRAIVVANDRLEEEEEKEEEEKKKEKRKKKKEKRKEKIQ